MCTSTKRRLMLSLFYGGYFTAFATSWFFWSRKCLTGWWQMIGLMLFGAMALFLAIGFLTPLWDRNVPLWAAGLAGVFSIPASIIFIGLVKNFLAREFTPEWTALLAANILGLSSFLIAIAMDMDDRYEF